jgi:hypothetical protein
MRWYFWLTVVSALASNLPEVVFFGMPNYYEGLVHIGCYVVLFETAQTVRITTENLSKPLKFVTASMFSLCALQYFSTNLFSKVINPILGSPKEVGPFGAFSWPLFGVFMNSNILGTFAAIAFGYFAGRRQWGMTAISVLMAVGSQSRGAWLAIAVSTIYLGFKWRSLRAFIPVLCFVSAVPLVWLRGNDFKISVNSSGRVYIWRNMLTTMSWGQLAYGYGPGTTTVTLKQDDAVGKRAQGWDPKLIIDRPHNFYLQVLHDSGGIALLSLLALFGWFILNSKDLAINAAVISYLVNVFFTDSCTSVAPLFWIILGSGVGKIKPKGTKWAAYPYKTS